MRGEIRRRHFTRQEDEALRQVWQGASSSEDLRASVPGRLFATLVRRAEILGLPKRKFRAVRGPYLPARYKAVRDVQAQGGVDDRDYVAACVLAGGFPYAILTGPEKGTTVWPFRSAA